MLWGYQCPLREGITKTCINYEYSELHHRIFKRVYLNTPIAIEGGEDFPTILQKHQNQQDSGSIRSVETKEKCLAKNGFPFPSLKSHRIKGKGQKEEKLRNQPDTTHKRSAPAHLRISLT